MTRRDRRHPETTIPRLAWRGTLRRPAAQRVLEIRVGETDIGGVHCDEHPWNGIEVPHTNLVSELAKSSDFYTTQRMEPVSDFFHDIEILPAATLPSGQDAA